MKIETLEISGLVPAMQALRLPYSRSPRSRATSSKKTREYQYEFITERDMVENVSKEDLSLASRLVKSGDCEAKAVRGVIAYLKVTAPRYWWMECATYRHGCECLSSESTMHTIARGVSPDMFDCGEAEGREYCDILNPLINEYNMMTSLAAKTGEVGEAKASENLKRMKEQRFLAIKRRIPECFLQTRILAVSYQCLRNMWIWRHNHRLPEWRMFCDHMESLPFAQELIFAGL